MSTRIRSYGEILSYVPVYAARKDGIFVAADGPTGAVGLVVRIVPCDDQQLRSVWSTWVVDLLEEPKRTLSDTSSTSTDVLVGVQLPVEATCSLIVSH